MYIIDTHAHYDDEQFDIDRDEVIRGLSGKGVGTVVNAGASLAMTRAGVALAAQYENVYCMVGIHPDSVGDLENGGYDEILSYVKDEETIKKNKIVAIGEIGLDYHWMVEPKETQIKWFREQINLARRLSLPINIHSRDAAEDTLKVLKEEHFEEVGGIIHCFSGSPEIAREYLKAGFYIGIGGVVTFKNGKKLKDVVKEAPLTRLVLETDCPYLAPEPHRGSRNDSSYLNLVAEKIAEIKETTVEEVITVTTENAKKIYRL